MAQNVPNTRTFKDVTGLTGGVNSFLDSQFIQDTQVRWAENAVNKGGIWQTRPGFDTVIDLSTTDKTSALYQWLVNYSVTSDTITYPTNTVSIYISSLRDFNVGENVTITSLTSPSNYMTGRVISHIDSQLTVSLSTVTGYGTFTGWSVTLNTDSQLPLVPQFFNVFQPTNGAPQFVYGISGGVFIANINSDGSYDTPRQLQQFRFNTTAADIITCQTVRSATIQDGVLFVTLPVNTLMMQDGVSRAAYWDGTSGNHLNPKKQWTLDNKGNIIYTDGYNQTRIGKYMTWSGNRLWVSNGTQLFASDLNDPLHFTEETVLTNIPSFTFPKNVTGLIDRGTSGNLENLMFIGTEDSIYVIHTGVQQRSYWVTVSDFVRKIFAGVGSVSHKAMICHMGLLYWYSNNGVVALDSLGTVTSTQSITPIDTEMSYSKQQMGNDRSRICAGHFDSYVWWSVPVAVANSKSGYSATYNSKVYNGHTQVLDRLVTPGSFYVNTVTNFGGTAWQGVWTGLRPIEWATQSIYGKTRTYCLSLDYDGQIRIWEGFNGNRCDNNNPIAWAIETKSHEVNMVNPMFTYSVFRYFRLLLSEIYGNLTINGYWKGLRGQYHQLLDTAVTATPGSILLNNPEYLPIINKTPAITFVKQTRDILSKDNRITEENTSVNVESQFQDDIDRAFSLLLQFNGVGALKAYRLAVDANPDNTEGAVVPPESGQHILPITAAPEYVSGAIPTYTTVARDSKLAITPVESHYLELGYQLPLPSP
jgi:hypothetical protein